MLLGHLDALHAFYGEPPGVRIARKHLGWYAKDRPENAPSGRGQPRRNAPRRSCA